MTGVDIANQLKARLPSIINDFTDQISITSLSRSGNTITAVTDGNHLLNDNNTPTIAGAKEPIAITSLTRDGSTVTAVCAVKHKLPNPANLKAEDIPTLEIAGTTPVEYSGNFLLVSTPDYFTFTYKITDTPATPATTEGFLLITGNFLYNGQKLVTVVNATTFTYQSITTNLQTPAQGTIVLHTAARIDWAATLDVAQDHYTGNTVRQTQNWLYIVVGDRTAFKKGTIADDIVSLQDTNPEYRYDTEIPFFLYIFVPTTTGILAGVQADQARDYIQALLKSIGNFILPSNLSEGCLNPVTYLADGTEFYNKAYYVHRFEFASRGVIVNADTVDGLQIVPLLELDADIKDKEDMDIEINLGD